MAKKYYILYKVERSEDGAIKDLRYIYEMESYEQLIDRLHIARRTISKMANSSISGSWDKLKTYNDFCIIRE